MSWPTQVRLVEMSPRDGLQNEPGGLIPTATKIELIHRLSHSGLTHIEATSFVSPKWVPQMADAAEVMVGITRSAHVRYAALTPNLQGALAAIEAGVNEIAVFTAASAAFTHKNINCDIPTSLKRFEPVIEAAQRHGIPVRGYVSTVMGCPYQGDVAVDDVAWVAGELLAMGCYEISLGDTIGVGTPFYAKRMLAAVAKRVPLSQLAAHFHDTYGQALANLYAVVEEGLSVIDASVAGLGGCPYAKGAAGNVATEDVIYMLQGLGIHTGVDLNHLITTSHWICQQLNRSNGSKVSRAKV